MLPSPLRLLSYNLNGVRSATRKGLLTWLQEVSPDVVCFQETRVPAAGYDWSHFRALGYDYIHEHVALRPGYSGVATLSRYAPQQVSVGTGNTDYDVEGRVLRTDFEGLTVINVYIPSGARGERQGFKMQWLAHFASYLHLLKQQRPALLICGDFNICHQPIDIHDPIGNKNSSGFLLDERAWLTQLLATGYIDSFRHLYPDTRDHYTWWSNRPGVRERNKGWRIDYALMSSCLEKRLCQADIVMDVLHSDHCPVLLQLT